jgi:hypothetical protein
VEAEKSGLDSGSSKCESDKLIEPATDDHATNSSIYLDSAGAGMGGGHGSPGSDTPAAVS